MRHEALDRLTKIASRVPGVVFQWRLRRDGGISYPFLRDAVHTLFGLEAATVSNDTAALREKSALLQEVHHRVKNNLQVVISLLRLEGRRAVDTAVVAALEATQAHIRAMALLHEYAWFLLWRRSGLV